MTTATARQNKTNPCAILDQLNHNSSPSKDNHIRAVKMAVLAAALEHRGEVTWAWVRPLVPTWVDPALNGSTYSALVNSGLLVDTGRVERSGDTKSRNGNKRYPIYTVPNVPALAAHVHGVVAA